MSKQNGITNVDTLNMEKTRQIVVEQELSARSWRAMRQKMEDTIAIAAIQEEYDRIVTLNQQRLDEARQKYSDQIEESLKEVGAQTEAQVVNEPKMEAVK